jgi:hypothetical protein
LDTQVHQHEELWLLGQPPLWRFLEFVKDAVVDGARADRVALTNEWCAANDYYQELENSEAGIANSGSHRALDPGLASLAEEVRAHPHYRRVFDTLPTDFGMVELDRLIVFQKHITRTFVDGLVARIRRAPDPERLFRICLPLQAAAPPVQICKVGSQRYVFRCESTDLRYHETIVLHPEQVAEYHSFGSIAGIIGVVVGFGCDFLQAVRVGNRVLLNNGYHRAYALRALGVTHAPCIIQTATRVDELQTVKGRVAEEAEFYFESARPPLLKDFFDPKIRKVLPIRNQAHLVEVSLEIRHSVEDRIEARDDPEAQERAYTVIE